MMPLRRRQFLQALGLGALASVSGRVRTAFGKNPNFPTRIVFFVQPHGNVPKGWKMPIPGGPTDAFASRSLLGLAESDFSEVLRPLFPFRDRILPIEGLAHTSVTDDIAKVLRTGGDLNNHSVSVAGLLSGAHAKQMAGSPCTGGARTLDQEIAARTGGVGRFGSRVYGFDYVPNATVAPFSFLGPGQASPIVADPAVALADLLGYYVPPASSEPPTRESRIRSLRPSVLDAVSREYELLAPKLDAEGRTKLDAHRALVRDLEASLGGGYTSHCDPSLSLAQSKITSFMRLIRMAFACDLTRVATFVAPVPPPSDFGYPADKNVHGEYAHASVEGATSCGTTFSKEAERAMIDLGIFYAKYFAALLQELDSVIEGGETLLDHTLVVWVTELATPTHRHHDTFALIAGGGRISDTGGPFFRMGNYVRYPAQFTNPIPNEPRLGPGHNRLHVSLLAALGEADRHFGLAEATGSDGSKIPLTDPLQEIHVS